MKNRYDSVEDFLRDSRLEPHARNGGTAQEMDWGIYRGAGWGSPGSNDDGWLVTFAFPAEMGSGLSFSSPLAAGYLVAYRIVNSKKTGEIRVLGGPWNWAAEEEFYKEAQKQRWWRSAVGGAHVNVEDLDNFLPDGGLH